MPRKPKRRPCPFQLACLERVHVDGRDFTRQEILFTADVLATWTHRHGALHVMCTLTPSQAQQYGRALMPRYTATQECAWVLTIPPAPPQLVIGYVTEIACFASIALPHMLEYRVMFQPSGSTEIPVHQVPTRQQAYKRASKHPFT